MLKIVTIVGSRPQFVKSAAFSKAIRDWNEQAPSSEEGVEEILVHTGQHYDRNLSTLFFEELELSPPKYNLEIGSGTHAYQIGQGLLGIEKVLLEEQPDWVVVYGDTNATLSGALATKNTSIKLAHIEAGLRSYNRDMPEETNRVLTDQLSDVLFCPTKKAVMNLEREGLAKNAHQVGDVMYDMVGLFSEKAAKKSAILEHDDLAGRSYALATVHRANNTDDPERLRAIFEGLAEISKQAMPVVFPMHPRTEKKLEALSMDALPSALHRIEPVSYLEMLNLQRNASVILTDSGGVQKEAYFCRVPCLTLRDETEWTETVESGWNRLVSVADPKRLVAEFLDAKENPPQTHPNHYGDGEAAWKILSVLRTEGIHK